MGHGGANPALTSPLAGKDVGFVAIWHVSGLCGRRACHATVKLAVPACVSLFVPFWEQRPFGKSIRSHHCELA